MRLDRLAGHAQCVADFLVREPIGDQANDVGLTWREHRWRRVDPPLEDEPPRCSGTHGLDELAGLDALGDEPGSTSAQGDVMVLGG